MPTPAQQIADLREEIRKHDHHYWVESAPIISDREYDKLFSQLKQLEKAHPDLISPDSPTQRVSETPIAKFENVTHAVPMLSIDNTYNEDDVREFDARVAKALDGESYEYIVDPKIDGVSATLRYVQGVFTLGATRGDGRTGDDVTANLKTVRSIPLRLRGRGWPEILEVRGEVFWPRKAFDACNARRVTNGLEPFANPRNATAGTIKQLDTQAIAGRGLAFIAHGFGEIAGVHFESTSSMFQSFKKWGVPVSPHEKRCTNIDAVIKFIHEWDTRRRDLEYETDGLVIKINHLDQRQSLGATSRYPRWCIAYKYAAEQAETVLESVDFQVGKLGTITPRAKMRPVQLSGTTVRHASLHNFDQVDRLDVRIGDTIVVEKAGEIIPQVVSVVKEKRPKNARKITAPKKCPICKGEVARDEGGVYIRCINPACDAQLKERLKHFCGRNQMDIESAGAVLIEQLVDAGLVHGYADLYALQDKRDALLKLERMGEKSADNLLAALEQSKKQPLARVLAALNIRHVGTSSAELIADHFEDMANIAQASEDDLQAVDGVGPEMATSLHVFFNSDAGRKTWQALRVVGVNMTQPRSRPTGDRPLAGKTIVVTGTLENFGRKEIERLIKDLGGKTAASVSKNTDFVVAGDKAGSKLDKAEKLGVDVLDEAAFLKLAGRG